MYKELAFPNLKSLSGLFSSLKYYKPGKRDLHSHTYFKRHPVGPAISTFCQITGPGIEGYHTADAVPNEVLDKYIAENMLDIDGGVFFEIVCRKDGTALVIVKYNAIIGDRWLAEVPTDMIPGLAEEEQKHRADMEAIES